MNPISLVKKYLFSPSGVKSVNDITASTPDNTIIVNKNKFDFAYIPLTPEEETNNTIQFFVKPKGELIFKRGVAGEYDRDGKFRYTDGFVTHYLIEGIFTNSGNEDSYMSLLVPRQVIERNFVIK